MGCIKVEQHVLEVLFRLGLFPQRLEVEALPQPRHLLGKLPLINIQTLPGAAVSRQRPYEALLLGDEIRDEGLFGTKQRLRLGHRQRLGIDERRVVRELLPQRHIEPSNACIK